jgi:hypothetical protein
MKSRSSSMVVNSPLFKDSRGGARRHPYLRIDVDAKADERPQDFLRPLNNEMKGNRLN